MTRLTPSDAIVRLEEVWAEPDGFFYRLRQGDYDSAGAAKVEDLLRSIHAGDGALPRRFVALTWLIPTFMEWQIERVGEHGGDTEDLRKAMTRLQNALDALLGNP